MPEEELNKMAVHLLNCQLHTENRPTFECEESMSIGTNQFVDDSDESSRSLTGLFLERRRMILCV